MKNKNDETHRFLPSGEWEGFYCYNNSRKHHKILIQLHFANSIVSGFEVDIINSYRWNGFYDTEHSKISMIKTYPTDTLEEYKGEISKKGIRGIWEQLVDISAFEESKPKLFKQLKGMSQGKFHIWPKTSKNKSKTEVKKI